jgi:hypothetical protein
MSLFKITIQIPIPIAKLIPRAKLIPIAKPAKLIPIPKKCIKRM